MMTEKRDSQRSDMVSRVILAAPRMLYRAHLDAEMMANWRAPEGVRAEILAFDGRLGGSYRMALHSLGDDAARRGKSGPGIDRFTGVFVELIPDEKIVERIQFETTDPAFAEPMVITTTLRAVRDGTKVTVEATHVSPSISPEDHETGMTSSLRKLAMLTE
jgi:uncharacterized protein YndB with AHSA1/START domain